jgi:hypothetical protein
VKLWGEAVLPSLAFNCAECRCIEKCRKKHVRPKVEDVRVETRSEGGET